MQALLEDAASIFETASAAPADGQSPDLAILVGASGTLRIVDGAGWRPEALQAHYGARTVFHVTHAARGVRVEAHDGRRSCVLEGPRTAARLPVSLPLYSVMPMVRRLTAAE